jgi:PTS system nitrogen regulatory IIA component
MAIKDFLSLDDVIVDVRPPDKNRLLLDLSRRAATRLDLDQELVVTAILKREELGSTGTGDGTAIPHARIQDLKKPFAILARLGKPIPFDAIDGLPVDVVALLLLPVGGEQLNALAAVARKLRDPVIAEKIRRARDEIEMYRIVAAEQH